MFLNFVNDKAAGIWTALRGKVVKGTQKSHVLSVQLLCGFTLWYHPHLYSWAQNASFYSPAELNRQQKFHSSLHLLVSIFLFICII